MNSPPFIFGLCRVAPIVKSPRPTSCQAFQKIGHTKMSFAPKPNCAAIPRFKAVRASHGRLLWAKWDKSGY
ncbi:hypothetical protein CEXT_298691 [Caerostris extrusa]|uniref:Uncharacterized protein n=1 Tax=Caerostris extrusa TaxID=172846 RepID=A0AAV4XYI0_CAEEX|nr:hypothetical protein CEXT_298691 [Caerostris extrusa]